MFFQEQIRFRLFGCLFNYKFNIKDFMLGCWSGRADLKDDSVLKRRQSAICIISNRDGMLEWNAIGSFGDGLMWYLVMCVFYLRRMLSGTHRKKKSMALLTERKDCMLRYIIGLVFSDFFCLFGFFFVPVENFWTHIKTYNMETINEKGLQILTYARHSWPLSNEDFLACHIYCDTGHPLKMVFS